MIIIDSNSISHIYVGNVKPSLDNLCFSMKCCEFVAIIGAKGNGKSYVTDIACGRKFF